MDNDGRGILGDPQATGEEIRLAWENAAANAMANHRQDGVPIATWDWQNGQVLLIPADDSSILAEPALSDQTSN